MAYNMIDYLNWRGDLSFPQEAPNEVDFLILSELIHAPLELLTENVPATRQPQDRLPDPADPENRLGDILPVGRTLYEITPRVYPHAPADRERELLRQRYQLWMKAAYLPRFGSCRLVLFSSRLEKEERVQFAAALFCCEDIGIVTFRGTDSTLVGWHEDFALSYESPIPAQRYALQFLTDAAESFSKLYVCGHSKGGNLAMYAAARASVEIQEKILGVYNFDGPGLDEDTLSSEGMSRVKERIHSILPEGSVVGKLLGYQTNHERIQSEAMGLFQHNPFGWHVMGSHFVYARRSSLSSEYADASLHQFLKECDPRQRQVLVDTLFTVLSSTGAGTLSEVGSKLLTHWDDVLVTILKLPEEDRKLTVRGLRTFLNALGSGVPVLLLGLLGRLEKYIPET